jgi:hypothetical protein
MPLHTHPELKDHSLEHSKQTFESYFDGPIAVALVDAAAILRPAGLGLTPIGPNRFCVFGGRISDRESAIARLVGVNLHSPSKPKSKPKRHSAPQRKPIEARPPPPHAPAISDDHMRLILLMDEAITRATPPGELIANPRLGLHLREGPAITGPFIGQGSVLQIVPASLVSFLVESFAAVPHQPNIFKKVFPKDQKPIALRLPIRLPITVATNGETVTLGYFDTPRIPAIETKNHVTQILNNLWRIPVLLASFRSVDPTLFVRQLLAFANDSKLVVMYDIEHENKQQETADLTVRVLKSHWDEDLEGKVHGELQRIFDDSAVFECSTCQQLFARVDGSRCTRPGAHVAEIPRRNPPSAVFAVTKTLVN